MLDRIYADYAWEQAAALLAVDSPSGYTAKAAAWVKAAFEKLGACASYVVREGEVRALRAETLPMGVLPDVESHSLRMTLRPGDVILLMTDGVTDAFPGGEDGLRAAIEKLCWLHPQSVGERLIAQALSCGEAKDDMAVLCARVGRRGVQG